MAKLVSAKKKAAKKSNRKKGQPPLKENGQIVRIEEHLSSKYDFRYNPISDRTEFKLKKGQEYQPLTERDINSLFRELNYSGIKSQINTLKSIIHSNYIPSKDPFVEYFESLPVYKESQPNYINQLMDTVEATNDPFFRMAFPKWLVSTVACSINPKEVNQHVLVFVGKQGIGKSTWLNKLVPEALDGYLYSGIVNPNNKDTLVNLSENFIINLDELENLNKTELGSLKALITQSAIRLRKAYGIFNENFVRRASFLGSVNEVEFLNDPTGNRRYLVINCIDIDYLHGINMDLVYSQAYYYYKQQKKSPGTFKYHFDKDETIVIEENNKQFYRVSIEEDLLFKYFRLPEPNDQTVINLTNTEIMNYVTQREKMRSGDPSFIRRLGSILKKNGFIQKSINNQKPYILVELKPENKNKPASNTVGAMTKGNSNDFFDDYPDN